MSKIYQHQELLEFLPPEVKKLFAIFGSKIRLVGGAVRELLLEKKVNDFDFATPLSPQEVIAILEFYKIKAIPTGVKFGTVTAVLNNKNFEITTLRKDIESDGRHAIVEFVDDYFFDAARRDFTINALYLDEQGVIYDYFEGITDLENKKVKFIGDANSRIAEDYLRILRFFRFSCNYAAEYDLQGLTACIKQKENLKSLSADRVRNEIFKVLAAAKKENLIRFFEILEESQIAIEIFYSPLQITNFKKIFKLEGLLNIKTSDQFKFFILICEQRLNLEKIFFRFNFSNQQKKYFKFLFENFLNRAAILDNQDLKELLVFEQKELVYDFYLLNSLYNLDLLDILKAGENLELIKNFILKDFPLSGEDVTTLGFEGEKISAAIKKAKIFWAKSEFKLGKSELISFLNSLE